MGRLGLGGALTRGAVLTLTVKALGMPSTLLLQLALVRLLKPSAYGEFMYAYTWYMMLTPFAALGVQEAAVRYVAEYRARHEAAALRGFLHWSVGVALAGGVALAVLAAAATHLLRDNLTATLITALLLAWACLPMAGVTQVSSAILRALDRFGAAQAPVQVMQPLLIVAFTFTLVLAVGRPPVGATAMSGTLLAVGLVCAASVWLSTRTVRPLLSQSPRYHVGEWSDAALHLVGLALIVALWRVDVLMLGAMQSTDDAGIYATAVQLQLILGSVFYTLEIVIAPTIARLHPVGEGEKLQRILRLASRASTGVTMVGAIALVAFGRWMLALFDPAFVVGYGALLILAVGHTYDVLTGSSGRVLTMTGHHRAALGLMAGAMLANILLNWLLIPRMGMAGAATATTGALFLWKTSSLVYTWRAVGVDTSVLGGALLRRGSP